MQEFSSISVSSYEAGLLADRLTEQSHDGWSVVAIVPTGSTVTAYLSRSAGSDAAGAAAAAVDEPAPAAAVEPEPVLAEAHDAGADGWAAGADAPADITPEPATTDTAAAAAADTPVAAADTASAAASGAAPAGWYADPSTRFELRYWDGAQWTEHVSRAGQQYTDPPVA